MVCDFTALKRALTGFISAWDHALCLNTDDPQFAFFRETYGERAVAFTATDPTTEVLARAVFKETERQLADRAGQPGEFPIGSNVRVERVRVTETTSNWAEYFEG